jgi:hypothetical protein
MCIGVDRKKLHAFARAKQPWLIGATATVVYFVLRSTTDFVWNDTIGIFLLPPNATHDLPSLGDEFRAVSRTSNYRPLANYVAAYAVTLVGTGPQLLSLASGDRGPRGVHRGGRV